jgi:phosphate transport system substrate-binding protein
MRTLTAGLLLLAALNAPAADLRITGSNTFGEKLGPALVAGFSAKNPGLNVVLKRPGTAEGLATLIAGNSEIAPASRPANRRELAAAAKAGLTLRAYDIGSYGVSIIVNKANPLRSLKPSQIRAIFTGKVTDWSQLGAPAGPVNLYILGKNTGARAGFQDLAMKGAGYAASAVSLPGYAAIESAVAADPRAVGYTGMGKPAAGTRALLVNGEPANAAAIHQGVYPYANTLRLYTAKDRETPEAGRFIRFVLSREGQRIIQKSGFAPRPPAAAPLP